jgi:predicted branched-subunit amino acid permease
LPDRRLEHAMTAKGPADAPYWSLAGLAQGARLSMPALPAMAAFAAAFGALAAQKGLTLLDATLMSTIVFAGASQFVAMEIWTDPMTAATLTTLGLVTAMVNLRFVLMSASLRPWLGELPAWQTYPALHLLCEPDWLIAMRHRAEGGSDVAIFLGSGIAMWLVWAAATVAGFLLGSLISDLKRFGLDLVMPTFFVTMLIPLWRGPRRAIAWAIAGAVALLVAQLVAGWWFIIVGAVAGSIAGGLLDEPG